MTIKRKTPHKAEAKLDAELRSILIIGDDIMGRFRNLSPEKLELKLRELWELHREEVMKFHIESEPLSRPACWWKYDSPVPRPEIVWTDASDSYVGNHSLAHAKEIENSGRHGLPTTVERKILAAKPGVELPPEHGLLEGEEK
jgi:hypothetical protein